MGDISYSYSFFATFKKCPKRAKLMYVDRVIDESELDYTFMYVGIVVDAVFTLWVNKGFSPHFMESQVDAVFNSLKTRFHCRYDFEGEQKALYRCRKLCKALESICYGLDFPSKKIETQVEMKFIFKDKSVRGKADIWIEKEGLLLDLKTTYQRKYLDEFQLHYLAWLFESAGGKIVNRAGFLLPSFVEEPLQLFNVDVSLAEREVLSIFTLIDENRWPRNTKACWDCQVKTHCWALVEEDVKEEAERLPKGGFRVKFKSK